MQNRSEIRNPQSAIQKTRELLAAGKIVAIKGLGGFHLACDALQGTAVAELRRRKLRREKPFALMMPDLETVERHCYLNDAERELLASRARPIVLLRRRPNSPIAAACAPGQRDLGVMLPYTPLHYLLLEREKPGFSEKPGFCDVLVMTSGNLSEEPIAYTNEDARRRLSRLADAFLMHDRDIHVRCDDSVMRVVSGQWIVDSEQWVVDSEQLSVSGERSEQSLTTNHQSLTTNHQPLTTILPIRRSRGYAPFPVQLPWEAPPLLATGAELKNTFCLSNGRYAFLSHHIGDMENYETLRSFEEGAAHFEKLFRVTPQAIAYDLHPNYLATRYALERAEREGIPAVGVQHHHAHIAAVLAEHRHPGDRPVIGVSFDGAGYGDDGAIWGGEFLLADYAGYERPYHLRYVPLPGGDKAVKEPWRLALAWGMSAECGMGNAEWGVAPEVIEVVRHQIEKGINAPLTSSMGRLFDAVAALAGVRQTVNYEAQAAMELEALVEPDETTHYPFTIHHSPFTIDPRPLIRAVVADRENATPLPIIAARFHNGVAQMVRDVCLTLRQEHGVDEVAVSGGVWQNVTLLRRTVPLLEAAGFTVYLHTQVPPNDGGLALGQTAVAAQKVV
jgi:hydrogenase maturation protein HypF